MVRTFLCTTLCTTTIVCSLAGWAAAQPVNPSEAPPPSTPAPPSYDPSAPPAPGAAVQAIKPGMTVTDSSGQAVGTVTRVGRRVADGALAAEVDVQGKPVTIDVAVLTLAPSGDHVITSASKAEIEAAVHDAPG